MTGQSTAFLVNPASAGGSTGTRWPEIARRAAELGLEGDAFLSEQPEHLRELARQAAAAGADLLVAVGGDGTVNEVVNGMASSDAPAELAVIPRGTGVDFVRTFDIPASSTTPSGSLLQAAREPSTSAARHIARGAATKPSRTSQTSPAPA